MVAGYLAITARGSIGRISIDVLMDRELPERIDRGSSVFVSHHPDVRDVHDLRTRSAGLTKFIQLHIVLDPTMSLGNAHVVGDRVEAALHEAFPQAEIILHVDGWDDRELRAPAA